MCYKKNFYNKTFRFKKSIYILKNLQRIHGSYQCCGWLRPYWLDGRVFMMIMDVILEATIKLKSRGNLYEKYTEMFLKKHTWKLFMCRLSCLAVSFVCTNDIDAFSIRTSMRLANNPKRDLLLFFLFYWIKCPDTRLMCTSACVIRHWILYLGSCIDIWKLFDKK